MSLAGRTVRLISQLGGIVQYFAHYVNTFFQCFLRWPAGFSSNTGIVPRSVSLYLADYAKLLSVSARLLVILFI